VYSSGFIMIDNVAEPASAWPFASALLNVMAVGFGSNPNLEKDQPSSSPSRDTPKQSVPQRWNLLLAEDNLPDALLVREVIRTENLPLELHIATDGQQAIEFIVKAEKNPDVPCPHLVLLDLNLPKVDGFDVLRRLRASGKCRAIPVLIVTSSDSPGDRSQASKLGAGYFRKPPSFDEFLKLGDVLKQMLKEKGVI